MKRREASMEKLARECSHYYVTSEAHPTQVAEEAFMDGWFAHERATRLRRRRAAAKARRKP